MSKTNANVASPPLNNPVTPGTATGVAPATAGSSRTNERARSVNATTTSSFPLINSFFNSPALIVRQNNNERSSTYNEGGREDDLRTRKLLPSLLQRSHGKQQ